MGWTPRHRAGSPDRGAGAKVTIHAEFRGLGGDPFGCRRRALDLSRRGAGFLASFDVAPLIFRATSHRPACTASSVSRASVTRRWAFPTWAGDLLQSAPVRAGVQEGGDDFGRPPSLGLRRGGQCLPKPRERVLPETGRMDGVGAVQEGLPLGERPVDGGQALLGGGGPALGVSRALVRPGRGVLPLRELAVHISEPGGGLGGRRRQGGM